ncbi:MAG: hypothetical protein CVU38_16540 [Chloroflexi bacterium HGW-Chloroflexi-1]|nr:MAG: hypothetical protein CVU38_16540 [Chloroflexi bacterium HGW-Chloroflexi-1]
MIALPRIVIDFDEIGNPSVLGLKMADAGRLLGQDLSGLRLNKYYVDWMTAANVQHIELRQTGNGIALLANGKLMPHVAWNDASLQQATEFAGLFDVQGTDMIKKFMPIVRRLGLDIILRFPKRADVEEIPLATDEVAMAAAAPEDVPASAVIRFEVKYDDRGIPSILGISAQDLLAMGINLSIALPQDSIRTMQSHNVQHLELRGKTDGLFVYVNGNPLPNLVWDNDLLSGAADLYAQMNPSSPYIELAKLLLPSIDNADIAILVHFPLAAGATPIPAQMH